MGVMLELPRKDPFMLGDMLANAIDMVRTRELATVYSQALAVRRYLRGDRNFIVEDFNRIPSFIVQNPPNQPPYEMLVGEVQEEIGKQLLIDVSPSTFPLNQTLQAVRDSAVGGGTLNYYFDKNVIEATNAALQESRVIDGCAGLAVEPVMLPRRGWGLSLHRIPLEELIILPAGHRDWDKAAGPGWRRWVPLNWLKRRIKFLNRIRRLGSSKKLMLPAKGTAEYRRMGVVKVPIGSTIRDTVVNSSYDPISGEYRSMSYSEGADQQDETKRFTSFVQYVEFFNTPDKQHLYQWVCMVGRHVLADEYYEDEDDMPQVPMGITVYAAGGDGYGRSYGFPKLCAGLYGERILASLGATAEEIDAYGLVCVSQNMGVDLEQIKRGRPGEMRIATYSTDAASPNAQPIQLKPINLGREYGPLAAFLSSASKNVFPGSPIFQGQATGRFESDKALQRLVQLAQTSLKAGTTSMKLCYSQCYRAGLEMIGDSGNSLYEEQRSIPLTLLSPSMVGIVLDTEEPPKSLEEQQEEQQANMQRAMTMRKSGFDPLLGEALLGPQMSPPRRTVPVPRFKVGPNKIPHPDDVGITISSISPRDPDDQWNEIRQVMADGFISPMQAIIRAHVLGLDKYCGGEEIIASYQTVVLNLISAFGDGKEAGPTVLPPGTGNRLVGWWVLNAFCASPVYLLASNTVQRQIQRLLSAYGPVNTPGTVPSGDEAAYMQKMAMQQQQMKQRAGVMLPGSQPVMPGMGGGGL